MTPSATSVFRIGVIGCGNVAESRHLPALQRLPNAQIVALADTDESRLQRVAARFGISRYYTAHERLLEEVQVDVVAICVPALYHAPIALDALDAGKHVFIEKPLALNLDDCDHLIAQATKTSVKATVGFNLRHHPFIQQIRCLIKQGCLGALRLMQTALTSNNRQHLLAMSSWRKHRQTGGGVFVEQAVHHFDLWRFLLQSEIQEVFAYSQPDDISASVTACTTQGVLISSVFSEATVENDEVCIYGEKGCLRASCYRFDGLSQYDVTDRPGDVRVRLRELLHLLRMLPHGFRNLRDGDDFSRTYQQEWQDFLTAIQMDRLPACTLEDGRAALQIVLSVAASASLGKPVKVAEAPTTLSDISSDAIKA